MAESRERATFQRGQVQRDNGDKVTYWGVYLSTAQLVLGALLTVVMLLVGTITLVRPWVASVAEAAVVPLIATSRAEADASHGKDIAAIREKIQDDKASRDEAIREMNKRLERIEAKMDSYIANRREAGR